MNSIQLQKVSTHNLRSVDVSIPYRGITVVTGVSGSGKSSLALDTLYAEGQRRFIESLSAYARQFLEKMERPPVENVLGMLPAIAIESKNSIVNARSTVGTQTEINDYLRLFFARVGKTQCDACNTMVEKDTPESAARVVNTYPRGTTWLITFTVSLPEGAKKNRIQYGQEIFKQGFSRIVCDREAVPSSDPRVEECFEKQRVIEVVVDRITLKEQSLKRITDSIETAFRYGKGRCTVWKEDEKRYTAVRSFSSLFHCPSCGIVFSEPHPHMFSFNSPLGACATCQGFGRIITMDHHLVIPDQKKSIADGAIAPFTGKAAQWEYKQLLALCRRHGISTKKPWNELSQKEHMLIFQGDSDFYGIDGFFKFLETKMYKVHVRVFLSRYRSYVECPECRGSRLKHAALSVRIEGKNMYDVTCMTIGDMNEWIKALVLSPYEESIAGAVLLEIKNRLQFLMDVGLGYLTLDRLSRTLSGGETQRINLASALGASLVDTLYVLDEPSIGLHPRDNAMLISILKKLKQLGNTVVVIEHDNDMIRHADTVIDLGPYAGDRGGRVVYAGTVAGLKKSKESLTGAYMRGEHVVSMEKRYREKKPEKKHVLMVRGAHEHNLKNIDVGIPLKQFVVITGVSGSGKSTLLYDVLYNNFLRSRGRPVGSVGAVRSVEGYEYIGDMVLIDQTPIGRTPRSNPVTFMDAFGAIRTVFARTRDARMKRMDAGHFSFNVEGGRCEKCEGDGSITVEMHFLADVHMTCEACQGTRFKPEVLEVRYEGKNIHEVLSMTVDTALTFFKEHRTIVSKLQLLHDVGLGYLTLGQPAPTLSQGEAQRLKLAQELLHTQCTNTMYLFDEPTVGLHYHDITYLMKAFERLLERGNSVVVIEHNIEVIKCADYLIDLGPEGGDKGGSLLYAGVPQGILREKRSHTAVFLKGLV